MSRSPLPDTPTKRKLVKAIKHQFLNISKTEESQLLRDLKEIAHALYDLRTQPQLKIKEWYRKNQENEKRFELSLSDDLRIKENIKTDK